MIEGAPVPSLGLYLLVEKKGSLVKRIFFSPDAPAAAGRLAEEIAAYMEKGGPCPQAELDLSSCSDFQKEIYALVRAIPRGSVMTYGQVAALAGRPGASRAVGRAMATNPFAILIPCHRVLARDSLGGYAYGQEIKVKLLRLEGHPGEDEKRFRS